MGVVAVAVAVAVAIVAGVAGTAHAHPLEPALLDVHENGDGSCDVRWRVPVVAPVIAPIAPELPPTWPVRQLPASELSRAGRSLATHWRVDCAPAGLVGARLAVNGLDARRTDALVRVTRADGTTLQAVLRPGHASVVIPAATSTASVLTSYLMLGVRHILSGVDHLLFVLGLLLLAGTRRQLLGTVTSFTLGHSVTLSLAALGLVRLPPRPIEVLIALSIFVVGIELARPPSARRLGRRPWLLAFAFGILHGLGFAGALAQVGLPQHDIPVALVSFNLGIEIGQLVFIAVALVARRASRALDVRKRRPWLARVPAYVIGSFAVFFILDRL
jgi:hydrogenase/urease accessory protein HupE